MRHTYPCPLRWADMDMLRHVNNVVFADYLQEARIDMFALHPEFSGGEDLAEGVVVVRQELEYQAPLSFRRRPVAIDSWVTEVRPGSFTMAYEMYDPAPEGAGEAGRVVYLRASSVLAPFVFASESPRRISAAERSVLERYLEPAEPRDPLPSAGTSRHVYPVQVRWSDVDAYRHVNNVKYLEYFQEARLSYNLAMRKQGAEVSFAVMARTDVDYRRPILFRREPYQVHSWVSRIGTTSVVFAAEIRDGEEVLARGQTVAVGYDHETNTSGPFPESHLAVLRAEFEAAGGG